MARRAIDQDQQPGQRQGGGDGGRAGPATAAAAGQGSLSTAAVLSLQRSAGNAAASSVLRGGGRPQLDATVDRTQVRLAGLAPADLPAATDPGAARVLAELARASSAGARALAATTGAALRRVSEAADAHAGTLTQAEQEHTAALEAGAEQAAQGVAEAAGSHAGATEQAGAAQQAQVQAWHQDARGRGDQAVAERQRAVRAATAAQAAQARATGDASAGQAGTRLTATADELRPPGGGGAGSTEELHAEVDQKVSGDAARQAGEAAPETTARLRGHASQAAGAIQGLGADATATIGREAGPLGEQLGRTATAASAELAAGARRGAQDIRAHGRDTGSAMRAGAFQARTALAAHAQTHREEIHRAAADAASAIGEQALEVATQAQASAADAAGQIAAARIDPETAGGVAAELGTRVEAAYADAAAPALDAGGAVAGQLGDHAGRAAAGLADAATRTVSTLGSGATGFAAEAARVGGAVQGGLATAGAAARSAGDEAVAGTAARVEAAAGTATSALEQGTGAVDRSLTAGVADTDRRAAAALTSTRGRVAEGRQRVDERLGSGPAAQRSVQHTVQRGVLSAIGNWFAEQLGDLWDMMKRPSFWLGLVVTIVLFPTLGPGALVVGGAVAGAVSGIEDNIKAGRHWYDPHAIIRNAFIGTVAGAAMAFGVGFLIGVGAEGAALLAGTMVLGALTGIVTNLATGVRWDKGLLANLFLAWLFHRVFGAKGRGTEPEPRAPGEKPPTEPVTKQQMIELIREMEGGMPAEQFTPRHAEALAENARLATGKWVRPDGTVPWDSIANQMGLSRWRFLPRAPEAAAILRKALTGLPEDGPVVGGQSARARMLAALDAWERGSTPTRVVLPPQTGHDREEVH